MASPDTPKIGAKLRRLRRDDGMTQAQLAERLGISPSYLNLIEHNRRKVTVAIMMRLSDLFEIPVAELADSEESRLYTDVMEALGDELFQDLDLRTHDVRDLVESSPETARALLQLYDAYHTTLTDARSLAARAAEEEGGGIAFASQAPADLISDLIQERQNFFQDLEDEADRVRREIGIVETQSDDPLTDYLRTAHGCRVAFVPPVAGRNFQRRYDKAQNLLEVSARIPQQSRSFHLAQQIGLMSAAPVLDMLLTENGIRDGEARALGRIALANYFAAALLMPYDDFLTAARDTRYDIELLQHRYGVSFEQAAHRLTSLNRPDLKGVPLHMLRVDLAGNVSKRFSLSGLPIPRHGGACARWNVYSAFLNPGTIQAQVSKLPEGTAFFCIARTVTKGGVGFGAQRSVLSIGLGCDVRYAKEIVYADGLDLERPERFSEIGVACRICERMDCGQRAFPPVHLRFRVDETVRGPSPYTAPGWPHHHQRPGPTR